MEGRSIRQSMKDAGYSERTAHGHCDKNTPVVNRCMMEIAKDFDMSKITPAYILSKVESISNDPAASHSDKLRANELIGKFLKMWVDRQENTNLNPDKILITYNTSQTIDTEEDTKEVKLT